LGGGGLKKPKRTGTMRPLTRAKVNENRKAPNLTNTIRLNRGKDKRTEKRDESHFTPLPIERQSGKKRALGWRTAE